MPRTIHNKVAASLEPWLDLAAIFPADEELVPPGMASSAAMERVFRSVDPTGTSLAQISGLDASSEDFVFWSSKKFPELLGRNLGDHTREGAARVVYNL